MGRKPEFVENFVTTRVRERAQSRIDGNSTVKQALDLMKTLNTRILVITQNEIPIHIVEDWKIWDQKMNMKLIQLDHSLFEPAYKVRSSTPLDSVMQQLGEKVAIIIVDNEDRMIGILTASDLWKKQE